jgi:DNA mismatch repair protein MutS
VREVGDEVLFLHRLVPGGADRSYGIEVGRLAGLPPTVIARAKQVLALLEGDAAAMVASLEEGAERSAGDGRGARTQRRRAGGAPTNQLTFFAPPEPPAPPRESPVVEALRKADPNHMTPMQALELVARLAAEARRA